MSELLVKPTTPDHEKRILDITPESSGWEHVGFAVHLLEPGDTLERMFEQRETCVIAISGYLGVKAGGKTFTNVGGRESVFEDRSPAAVYVPPGTVTHIVAETVAEVAICTAPSQGSHEVRLIRPEDINLDERGKGTNRRFVRNILPETQAADSLLIAEVITPGGHWSSYPPHKHDTDNIPQESALEETYYHRINPPQGFVVQRVYTDDRSIDETMSAHDRDVVLVPRGYHPVGVPHGYDSYYLNVMAGSRRTWIFNNDPEHEWIVQDQDS
jgi:5-deoxy-glucuronate isomerase